jgi:predicted dehydrogenase
LGKIDEEIRGQFHLPHNIKIGLVGTGFVQDSFHMPAYKNIEGAKVVAVAGRSAKKTEAFAKRWQIRKTYYGESAIERLCADDEIELVDIATPNDLHVKAITLAAEAHKHVICEKPLGRNAIEAKQALDVAERYGIIHCYAENQVFMPLIKRALEVIDKDMIGKVVWVRSREAHSGPHEDWFWNPKIAGGGVLLDMGCHSIEVARHLIRRKPTEVSSWIGTLVHKIKTEDNSLTLVKYENKELAQSENSWSATGGLDIRFEIYGSEGAIFIDATRETGIRAFTTAHEEGATYVVEKADVKKGWLFLSSDEYISYGFLNELEHFVKSVATGKRSSETFQDGLIVNSIIDAAYESSRSGKWTKLS